MSSTIVPIFLGQQMAVFVSRVCVRHTYTHVYNTPYIVQCSVQSADYLRVITKFD